MKWVRVAAYVLGTIAGVLQIGAGEDAMLNAVWIVRRIKDGKALARTRMRWPLQFILKPARRCARLLFRLNNGA